MKTGKTLRELAAEVVRQQDTKKDYIAQSQALNFHSKLMASDFQIAQAQMREIASIVGGGNASRSLTTVAQNPQGNTPITILEPVDDIPLSVVGELTHRQIAEHLTIPQQYYARLRTEFPQLLDTNVNTLMHARPTAERRMIRTLDGRVRAFLSDRYRRLDNYDLMEAILPTLQQHPNLEWDSLEITDSKLHLKVTSPTLIGEIKPGDVIQGGVYISNSEVGEGAFIVWPFTKRLICVNGMTHDEYGERKYHVGRAVGEFYGAGQLMFTDETLAADDRAFFLKARDIVSGALTNTKAFERILDTMRQTTEARLEGNVEKTVEVLANRHTLTKDEQSSILRNLIDGGDLSLWGLANAITATAGSVGNYDRATELETLGGRVITLPKSEWRVLATAGTTTTGSKAA